MGKILFLTMILGNVYSNSATREVVLRDVVVSCIRVVSEGENFHDVNPELFFWDEEEAKQSEKLTSEGYILNRRIDSDILCGGYTPNIEVNTRDRSQIMKAINSYREVIEDGDRIWITDLVYVK